MQLIIFRIINSPAWPVLLQQVAPIHGEMILKQRKRARGGGLKNSLIQFNFIFIVPNHNVISMHFSKLTKPQTATAKSLIGALVPRDSLLY